LLLSAITPAHAQERGVARLHALVQGLTVTPRVLIIGARPTDANADLMAWLARGHHVQTGFLSLTRGESAPNYTGLETGATLGAVHVQELLAARRIDGGEQYFTRAYDFGSARSAGEVFQRWDRLELLGDLVVAVRSFRPHVIVAAFRSDTSDHDGQQQASAQLAREVFDVAQDTVRYPTQGFGMPWTPLSLFEPGPGVTVDSREYDRMLGRTYAELAVESRAQLRSFGFASPPWQAPTSSQWRRIATRGDSTVSVTSLFSGVDTSFMRLAKEVPRYPPRNVDGVMVARPMVYQVPDILAYADSARASLDLEKPSAVVPYLRHVVDLASAARVLLRSCFHPARDAASSLSNTKCRPEWLDLDASLDLVLRRASDAVLAATGITFEAVADREFLASRDSALVTVTVFNNSDEDVNLNDVAITNAGTVRMMAPIRVPAHGSAQVQRTVQRAVYAHPWWIWKRKDNLYPRVISALDGVPRPAIFMRDFGLSGVAIPENIRRFSDVTVTLTLRTTTITASVGEVVFRTADPAFGMRDRAMSGVPAVTLGFERALEWAQAGKPLKKPLRVMVRSFSDRPQTVALKPAMAGGVVRIDSLPPAFTLAPHEAREVTLQARGASPEAMRYDLGLVGLAPPDTFEVGFRTAQYSYLPPLHLFRESNVSVLAVDIEIPSRLTVAYVRGAGEDTDVALKGLGIPTYVFNNEGLTRFDLDALSTVVIGPEALRTDRALLTQMPRLMEFARKGGTVVVMSNPDAVSQPGVLPFPVGFASPRAEQVTREDAPVAQSAGARVLTWPNVIRGPDWSEWVGARALVVPTTVDSRYATPVEIHDPGQAENRNAILVATVGKGRVVYTSLTLTQQIANAVPGAMRIFVNLLSAGLQRL
jgi:LmbE family N-acetylglucosaminyl deacetylase